MKTKLLLGLFIASFFILTSESGCEEIKSQDVAKSGVSETTTKVQTDLNGKTIEQNNIIHRLQEDNKPGSIKHLYVISNYSGQVLLYSTVKGKVTSSGKRLSPTMLAETGTSSHHYTYNPDLIQDDGTYGSSIEYIYWWDSKGIYHQHIPNGGSFIHISNEPIVVKSITLNLELNKENP